MNVKQQLVRDLAELAHLYSEIGDVGRSYSFKRASGNISNFPENIISGEQVRSQVANIGPSTVKIIDEFLRIGRISKITELREQTGRANEENNPQQSRERQETIDYFLTFHGIGRVKAEELYNLGLRSLEDIWNRGNLREATKTYIIWREHMELRIPREEMDIINSAIAQLLSPYGINWIMAGSYRRGEPSSGDVDILIVETPQFSIVEARQTLLSIMPAILEGGNPGDIIIRGILRLGPDYNGHRIDIHMTTPQSYIFALLYFTGSGPVNELMRSQAKELGMRLNEKGLQKGMLSINVNSEEDIFRILHLKYLSPEQRTKLVTSLEKF